VPTWAPNVGIVDVCAEAGLTKRYFYENFASIDTLADAVFEHVTGNLVAAVAPAIEVGAGRDPRPALTVYTRALLSDLAGGAVACRRVPGRPAQEVPR
jgi:AcrR family transcriptional regulator